MLKSLPESPDAIFIDQVVTQIAELGRVNHATSPSYMATVLKFLSQNLSCAT